jgi:dTDP-glucose 4,6-dehydratase
MRLAVTGGSGFFGINFINHVISKHDECKIINIDNTAGHDVFAGHDNIITLAADITDFQKMLRILSDIDCVVHFAGVSLIGNGGIPPLAYSRNNVLGTHILLEAAAENRVKKFILISSCEVYRNDARDFSFPKNLYAASKLGAEAICISYYNLYDFPALIIRSTNLFGPFQTPDRIISSFITSLLAGREPTVVRDGGHKREYLFVEDACEAIYRILADGETGRIYNLTGGVALTNDAVARRVLRFFKKDDCRLRTTPGKNNRNHIRIPGDRHLKRLGWKIRHSFDQGLRKTVAWYKENRYRYE